MKYYTSKINNNSSISKPIKYYLKLCQILECQAVCNKSANTGKTELRLFFLTLKSPFEFNEIVFSPTASQPVLWLDTRITIQLRILFPAKVMTYTVLLHINYCPQLPQQHHPNMNIHGQLLLFPDIGSDARDILFFFSSVFFFNHFVLILSGT